jgi:hypothetical protein
MMGAKQWNPRTSLSPPTKAPRPLRKIVAGFGRLGNLALTAEMHRKELKSAERVFRFMLVALQVPAPSLRSSKLCGANAGPLIFEDFLSPGKISLGPTVEFALTASYGPNTQIQADRGLVNSMAQISWWPMGRSTARFRISNQGNGALPAVKVELIESQRKSIRTKSPGSESAEFSYPLIFLPKFSRIGGRKIDG